MRVLGSAEKVAVQQALVAIETRFTPATALQIVWHIGKLLSHWDTTQAAAVKQQLMEDWRADMEEAQVSEAHVAEACAQWRRAQTFRPKVAEILALVTNIKARDTESARRARVLLGIAQPRQWEKLPALPAQTKDQPKARGMLAVLTARFARKPVAPSVVPGPSVNEILDSRNPAAVEKLKNTAKA